MKKRRIKKLVKGHLNSKDAAGDAVYTDDAAKKERLLQLMGKSSANPGSNLSDVQLLAVLLDADADSAAHKDDFAPFDAREQADVDDDNIGDNRDILLNKIAADVIFVKTINNADQVGAAGSLEDAAAKLETIHAALNAITISGDPGNEQRDDLAALQAGDADYTADGIAALLATVQAGRAEYLTLKANVDALTPTAGVTIDVAAPYNNQGDSTRVAADMATDAALIGEEGVAGRANDAKIAHDGAIEDLGVIANV